MALSDAEREKSLKRNKNRQISADTNKRWSDKQKLEAVHSYMALGNLALVGRVLGIPEITLRVWKASDWWKNVVDDIKLQERVELSNRMKKIVDAAHVIVLNRLETGDPVVTPKGDVIYRPVPMKDAHKVAVDLMDRRKMVESGEGPVTEEGKDTKLEKLAERFAEMALKTVQKKIDVDRTVDIEDAHYAVHDEREEGLQEGIREVPFEAGANQAPDGTDDGPQAG